MEVELAKPYVIIGHCRAGKLVTALRWEAQMKHS